MIEIEYGRDFLHSVKKIPREAQEKLDDLLGILCVNPYDPRLHAKQLAEDMDGYFSFRIMRDWRVLYDFRTHVVIRLLRVKHRKDAYR